jgi:hypothetical protein
MIIVVLQIKIDLPHGTNKILMLKKIKHDSVRITNYIVLFNDSISHACTI